MTKLDKEEQEILDSFERGEWISDLTPERLKELQSYAKAALSSKKLSKPKEEVNESSENCPS